MNFPVACHLIREKLFVVGLALAAGLASLRAAAPIVTVEQKPPRIEHLTFEPGHPPPVLQNFPGVEAAFCGTTFGCTCGLYAETPKFTFGLGAAKITSIIVSTRAHIIIWTPVGGPPEYLAHEETHRAISEHYYRDAGAVAKRLTEQLAGKKLDLPKKKTGAMLDEALDGLKNQLIADFMKEIGDRSEFAQDRFDTITNHGREPISNEEAMARAIADEAEHRKNSQR